MAISAQRFKFLNKETHIPVFDYTSLTDNQVYNVVDSVLETALEPNKLQDAALEALSQGASELESLLTSNTPQASNLLQTALNSAIKEISSIDMPDIATFALASLQKLDSKGVSSFIGNVLNVNKLKYCLGSNSLKYGRRNVGNNNLAALLARLLLDWLNRICSDVRQETIKSVKTPRRIEALSPPRGVKVTSNNAFDLFKGYYRDYIKSKAPINNPTALTVTDFISNVAIGNIDSSIENLKNAEISSSDKKSYLNEIISSLDNYSPDSTEYKNLLKAKAVLSRTPMISSARRDRSIKYEHITDKLGSFAKNLIEVKLSPISQATAIAEDIGLFNKLNELKDNATNSPELAIRNNNSGSYKDFNFSDILPSISNEEETHLLSNNKELDSHRLHDIHPTTEALLRV